MKYPKAILITDIKTDEVIIDPFNIIKPIEQPFEVRVGGNLDGLGFYLSNDYNWSIVADEMGRPVLIKQRK